MYPSYIEETLKHTSIIYQRYTMAYIHDRLKEALIHIFMIDERNY